MIKKLLIIFIFLLLMLAGVFYFFNKPKEDLVVITTLSISTVTGKFYDNKNFYLTIKPDDYIWNDDITFAVKESIYNKVVVDNYYAGVTLKITIPYNQPQIDVGMILKEKKTDYCQIISITASDNQVIN